MLRVELVYAPVTIKIQTENDWMEKSRSLQSYIFIFSKSTYLANKA